jgi:opacity protein-like surface antigen
MRLSGARASGIVVISCLCSLAAAAPAASQTVRPSVSGGYLYTQTMDLDFNGWYADVAVPFTSLMSFVGDASGAYFSESASVPGFSFSASLRIHTAMGGVRIAKPVQPKLVLFGQALAGVAATTGSAQLSGVGGPFDVSETAANFAIQLGGGVDVMLHPKIGVRVGASYMRIFADGDTGLNAFRFIVGGVLPLGSK